MRLGKLAWAIASVGVVAAFVPASASAEISLQFNGGGSNPPDGGPVSSFSWGASAPGSAFAGSGNTGRARYQQVTLTKPVDSSSPEYPYYLASNKLLRRAQILFSQPGSADSLALCMDNVTITKYSLNDASAGGGDPDELTESLTLNYTKISYVIYLDGGPFTATFDLRRGDFGLTTGNPCPSNT